MEQFGAVQAEISSALVSTTRSASAVAGEDLAFHRSLDPTLGAALDQQNARLLALTNRLLGAATTSTEIVCPPRLRDIENIESNWRAVVDVVDSLLERADTALDEFTGAVKRLSPGVEQASRTSKQAKLLGHHKAVEIKKPQLEFAHVPKNDESTPFRPLLESKPHALFPLRISPVASEASKPYYSHPYEREIQAYRYPASVYTQSEPIMYPAFGQTTAILVDTEEAVAEMLEKLKKAKEIAIDLEHHDQRSYIGIVSLMQISTRDQDWIVDTLKPWRRKLQCLNEVFADPNIVKVLHGAYMDVIWLQRDLGLYLVGLFDTHFAAKALGYPGGSLAFLLKKFVDFDAQKQYQMADWRVRPLPQELFDYARSDTHYLLYVFDRMRNELVERSDFSKPDHQKDKVWDVLQKSSETALQRYEHPIYDSELGQGPMGWYKLLDRTPALLSKQQFSVFRAVHRWRDDVARQQDDSVFHIMPNHNIFTIARTLPSSRSDLQANIHSLSPTVRERMGELLNEITNAKEVNEDAPDMTELMNHAQELYGHNGRKHTQGRNKLSDPVAIDSREAVFAGKSERSDANTTTGLLRSAISTFWGSAFNSSAWQQKRKMSSTKSVSLTVPLPPLSAEIFAEQTENAIQIDSVPISEPSPPPVSTGPEDQSDEAFILKNMSRKRKIERTEGFDGMAAQSDKIAIDAKGMDDAKARRSMEKAERRKAKKLRKQAAKDEYEHGVEDDLEPEFDYAAAPSILNPPREEVVSAKERKKREKQLNPYAKALDTAKGLPRAQKEKAGKSMTYRS